MSAAQELITIPKESALTVFSANDGLEPFMAKIRAEIDAFVPDISTKKGRDAVASMAHKVAKSKTYLDGVGKDLVAELKELPKKVDASRKQMRDTLDAWKDEVRRPLTEWEEAEQARIDRHKAGIEWLRLRAEENRDLDSDELRASIDETSARIVDESWEEFEPEAHRAKARALDALAAALAAREKYEAEQAELARLREEAARREQQEREERIAREAREQAEREAAQRAQAERDAAIKREAEAKAAAEHRELQLRLQAERAEKERLEAEQRAAKAAQEATEKAARDSEAARQRELQEAERREANKRHAGKINREAMQAFIDGGLTEDCAKAAVTLIAKHAIPHVSIQY